MSNRHRNAKRNPNRESHVPHDSLESLTLSAPESVTGSLNSSLKKWDAADPIALHSAATVAEQWKDQTPLDIDFEHLPAASRKPKSKLTQTSKLEKPMKKITTSSANDTAMLLAKLGMVAVGGFALWRNRFRIQRFLEAQGVSTPWMKSTVGEAIQSGGAKVIGSIEHEVNSATSQAV